MIKLHVNGSETQSSQNNLESFLSEFQADSKTFAVALNEKFISKKDYSKTKLHDGDQLEIVVPMQGG